MTYPDGATGIMIAGGFQDPTCAFLDLNTLEWESKASMPQEVYHGVSVPFGDDTFLIMGGWVLDEPQGLIYRYSPEEDEWEIMEGRMAQAKSSFPAFLVPEGYGGGVCEENDAVPITNFGLIQVAVAFVISLSGLV